MSKLEKPMVLLVDDNEATCTLVTALLQREFEVEVATDGMEAVDNLRIKNYAAVLLDLKMPQLDGYGVLDFIRANKPDMLRSTLILTAALTDREMTSVRTYDVCGVVRKPFEIETLLAAVKACVGGDALPFGSSILSSGMLMLLADLLRHRWM